MRRLVMAEGPWVVGALANQQWSITGCGAEDVDQLPIQPFVSCNLPDGRYFTSAPIVTANFSASARDQWTVPLGAGIGKLWRIGKVGLPLNTQIVPFYNVVTPDRAGLAAALPVPVPALSPDAGAELDPRPRRGDW